MSTIKIFLMSFGKILPITHNQFFNNKPTVCKKDEKRRNELQVKVNDKFDLIFNIFLKIFTIIISRELFLLSKVQ